MYYKVLSNGEGHRTQTLCNYSCNQLVTCGLARWSVLISNAAMIESQRTSCNGEIAITASMHPPPLRTRRVLVVGIPRWQVSDRRRGPHQTVRDNVTCFKCISRMRGVYMLTYITLTQNQIVAAAALPIYCHPNRSRKQSHQFKTSLTPA